VSRSKSFADCGAQAGAWAPAQVDQLKSRITQAKQLQQKLADVLVEQAVSQ